MPTLSSSLSNNCLCTSCFVASNIIRTKSAVRATAITCLPKNITYKLIILNFDISNLIPLPLP